MRILLISDHADPLAKVGSKEAGGQNVYVYYLGKKLSEAGVKVDVFTRWDRKSKRQIVKVNERFRVIRIKAGPKAYMPRDDFLHVLPEFEKNIQEFVSREKIQYDLIHTNYWFSGLAGLKLKALLNLPLVHVYHSIGEIRFRTLKKYKIQKGDYFYFQKRKEAEKLIAKSATVIVSTSPVEKKILTGLYQINPRKVQVIPIGVDGKIFKPLICCRAKKKLGLDPKKKLLLYVGRIEWRKGIGTLLYALKPVMADFPGLELFIIGGGKTKLAQRLEYPELRRQRQIIEELSVKPAVKYLGPIPQNRLYNYYSAADVCVTPSYYEPFGIVPVEAMACGTPVVASNTGGLKYTVKNRATGYLAKPRDCRDLADKIILALKTGKKHYTAACLRRVKKNFCWKKIIEDYLVLFKTLASKKSNL